MNVLHPQCADCPATRHLNDHRSERAPIVGIGLDLIRAGELGQSGHGAGAWPGAEVPFTGTAECSLTTSHQHSWSPTRVERLIRRLLVSLQVGRDVVPLVVGLRARGDVLAATDAATLSSMAMLPVHIMLTRREADVLLILSHGHSDKLIARELGIGVGTVKSHMKQLMLKFAASNRTQVVLNAMEQGLLAFHLIG